MINNRFRILGDLGEGGTGKVLHVEDSLSGQREAMKIFSSPAAQALDVDEVRREFSILIHLSHPNLVKVFDFGRVITADKGDLVGKHFYTMEYLEGKDSLSHFKACPSGAERTELLEVAIIQVLGVLGYIHRQGIIHFDIKPQNLIVNETDDQERILVKLTDFGFSSSMLETVDHPARGTLEYTAPELLQGLSIDHRLDLYSLGSTMYHLLTGHPAFEAPTSVELVKKVLTEHLPPLDRRSGESSVLVDVIETLCQKEPDRRYASALDALLKFSSSRHAPLVKKCLALARRPVFTGREKEKRMVTEALESALRLEEAPRVLALSGTEEMGKTEFLKEITKVVRARGVTVVETRVSGSRFPFESLLPVLRRIELEMLSMGNLPDPSPSMSISEIVQDSDVERVAHSHARFLVAVSKAFPFVLIADDFDKIDSASAKTIIYLSELLRGSRLLVLVSATGDSSLAFPFDLSVTRRIHLEELSAEEVIDLIRSSLGDQFVTAAVPEKLYKLYGGVPPLIVQAVSMIGDLLPLDSYRDAAKIEEFADELERSLPATLEGFFARRFSKLTKEELLLLQILASFDSPPSLKLLRDLVPMQPHRLISCLDLLEHEGHIARLDNGNRCAIRHSKLKEHLYGTIGDARTKLHSFIASALKRLVEAEESTELEELARQYLLAGDRLAASSYYEAAGDQAIQHQSLSRAVDNFERASKLRLERSHEPEYVTLQEKLARVYFENGSYQKSSQVYESLLVHSEGDDTRRTSLGLALGKALSRSGDHARALGHFEEALRLAHEPSMRFEIFQEIIALKIATGYYNEAVERCQGLKEFALQAQDREMLASVETHLGRAEFLRGNYEAARTSFSSALQIYRDGQNRQRTVDALINLGNVLSVTRDYRGALEHWAQALSLGRELGTLHHEGQVQNNMGIAHYKLREYEEARACYVRAKEVFEELMSKNGLALAYTNLGEVAYAESEYEQALEWWKKSLQLNEEMKDSDGIAESLLHLARVALPFGEVEQAQAYLNRAESIIEEHDLSTFRGQLSFLKGLQFLASGSFEDGRFALSSAREAFENEGDYELLSLSQIRLGEVFIAVGEHVEALKLLKSMLDDLRLKSLPLIKAECLYLLGCLAQDHPEEIQEKPLGYFKQGLKLIENEVLGGISWKLSYAVGKEYARRRQREKAERHYLNARLIIEHLSTQIKSTKLREKFLSVDNKSRILSEIASYLEQRKGDSRVQVA
jgi:serine/threonine protein kinase/tetratricopeptide (TPR) repeat protein